MKFKNYTIPFVFITIKCIFVVLKTNVWDLYNNNYYNYISNIYDTTVIMGYIQNIHSNRHVYKMYKYKRL